MPLYTTDAARLQAYGDQEVRNSVAAQNEYDRYHAQRAARVFYAQAAFSTPQPNGWMA